MIYRRPLRFTTLHFEQRFRIDDETFINLTPNDYQEFRKAKDLIIPDHAPIVQSSSWQGQDESFAIGDGDGMLPMCGERAIC